MFDDAPVQRFVPGAPPQLPLSKSQKKKRRAAIKAKLVNGPSAESLLAIHDSKVAALIGNASDAADVKKTAVAETPVAEPETIPQPIKDKSKKASPAVELLSKRIKVQNKKLSRISVYSSKPLSELNEDQKRSVASLPSIHGGVRELEETRKAMEALEAEEEKERARRRAEEELATVERIAHAITNASNLHRQRLSDVLSLLRLSSLLSASDPTIILDIDEKERHALIVTAETLLGPETPKKEETVSQLFLGDGDINGVNYARILQVVDGYRKHSLETESNPTLEEPASEKEPADMIEQAASSVGVPAVADGMGAIPSGSFHFMQESELEVASFENGAEWVEKSQVVTETVIDASEGKAPEALASLDTGIPLPVNGVVNHLEEPPLSAVSATLDWAADDGDGLPSINSLHAKFGTSGAATPEGSSQGAVPDTETNKVSAQSESEWVMRNNGNSNNMSSGANGNVGGAADPWGATASSNVQVDEEGFIKAKGSRGKYSDSRNEFQRGRGRGAFRGERGGEHRGGHRGRGHDSFGSGWRGGDGEFRGRGGYRGDRGRGGDFHGGEFRGRSGRGNEFRGRGRGERGGERGGPRGGRGGVEGNGDSERQRLS